MRYENEGIVNLVVGNATKIVYFCEQNFFLFKNTKVDFMEKSKWQIKVLIDIFVKPGFRLFKLYMKILLPVLFV